MYQSIGFDLTKKKKKARKQEQKESQREFKKQHSLGPEFWYKHPFRKGKKEKLVTQERTMTVKNFKKNLKRS